MTTHEMLDVLRHVQYKDWLIGLATRDGKVYLQVHFHADGEVQAGRKWFLSEHMTKSELVQTALKAVLAAEEHEAREKFLYRTRAIFGPHFDVDALHEIAARTDERRPK